MAVYFTADTHFGHEALLRHGYRAGSSIAEMDDLIVTRWNERVGPSDTVWHLGDFTMQGAEVAAGYLARLAGKIHLIWGNHDRNSVRRLSRWVSSQYATEINLDGHTLTLCHYGMRVWNRCHHGALMLYGHSHGSLPGNAQSLDVGADAWDFRPVTLAEILARMATLPPYQADDHHVAAAA